MRRLLLGLLAVTAAHAASPFDQPIARLVLTDGRTLANVQIVSFASSAVMAKWEGGRGTISYQSLPPDLLRAAQRYRPAASAPTPRAEASQPVVAAESRTLSGQICVTTGGGDSKVLADVSVYAFPVALLGNFETRTRIALPAPLAIATTDDEGNFTLKLPTDAQVFVYAHARRAVSPQSSSKFENYSWAVAESAVDETGRLILSNRNLQPGDPRVTIDQL
jgi:hypothetical protein